MTQPTVFGPNFEQRVMPLFPANNMTSYELHQPLETHYRRITCQEANCPKFHNGWELGYDLTDPVKVEAANLIKKIANVRGLVFSYQVLGTVVTFTFQPGQQCLEAHHEPLERDPFAIKRNGDWRGNPRREIYKHANLEDWVDDFQAHQDKTAHQLGVD
jgi:hypothetical protein